MKRVKHLPEPVLRLYRLLARRSKTYWALAVAAIVAGIILGVKLEDKDIWVTLRFKLYQSLQGLEPRSPRPIRTALVLIDDDDFWKGRLEGRMPLKRDYLADLLRAVDACGPAVIALDIDLRSPVQTDKHWGDPGYAAEDQELTAAIQQVSEHRPIVLPATIDSDDKGDYVLESAIYGALPLRVGKIQEGYIQLPYDMRRIPISQPLGGGGRVDSFAEAIVRATNANLLSQINDKESNSLPFGTFMRETKFPRKSAGDILRQATGACTPLRCNIAIIGKAWNQNEYNFEEPIDLHDSTVGPMRGAFIHANYVEAIIASRTYRPIGEKYAISIETVFSVFVCLLLASSLGQYKKLLSVLATCLAVFLTSYLFWQNLGTFFDFFFPVLFLLVHAFGDYWHEQHKLAKIGKLAEAGTYPPEKL